MEGNFTTQEFIEWFLRVQKLLETEIFTPANIAQAPVIFVTLLVGWLLARALEPGLRRLFRNVAVDDYQETFYVDNLIPLTTPLLWIGVLSASIFAAERMGWPANVLTLTVNLAVAWLLIRFASSLLPNTLATKVVATLAWTVAAINIVGLLDPALAALKSVSFALGGSRVSLLTILSALLTLGIFLWSSVAIARFFEGRIARVPTLSPAARVLFSKLLRISLIGLAFILTLAAVGIDLTAIAVFTGALGVGIGFGLQKSVANLFAGIILLLDKSIKPGDIIEVGGTFGWVASLGARYVEVETRDGTEFLIPNEDIITQRVFNWTHQNDNVRLKVRARVAFDADVRKALALMREAALRPERVLKTPAPNPLVIAIGDHGIELELRFWIADVRNGIHNVSSEVFLEIIDLFREHGIAIPLPQRDIHVQTLPKEGFPRKLFG